MAFPLVIHTEGGAKWMLQDPALKPEWWYRWSDDPYTYVPAGSPLLAPRPDTKPINPGRSNTLKAWST